jgi:AmmeMemoRadiSam system protein B
VIISTDLSHFYTLEKAKKLDNICLNAIENLDIEMLGEGCEACGMIGVEAMIRSAKKLGLNSHILDYRTSADSSGDESRVVGYVSAYFTE